MTCEIDINTSAVWEISKFMRAGGRTNYDTLWRDINNLDSALDSLRYYNNPSGSVNTHINEAQHNLDKCKSYCIEPTTNAMCNVASFLEDAAMQYEQTEREICNIWGYREKASCVPSVADVLGALVNTFARTAEFIFDHAADFIGNCIDNAIKYMKEDPVGFFLDSIAVIGGIALIASGPVGWGLGLAILAVNVIPSAYSIFSGGEDIWNDATVALLTPVLGDEAAKNMGRAASLAGAAASLIVPGVAAAKTAKAAMGAKKISNAKDALGAAKSFGKEFYKSYKTSNENLNLRGVVENPMLKAPMEAIKQMKPNGALKVASDLKNPGSALDFISKGRKTYEVASWTAKASDSSKAVSNAFEHLETTHDMYSDFKTIGDTLFTNDSAHSSGGGGR